MDMVNQVWSDQGKVVKCCEDMVVNTMVNIDTMNRELKQVPGDKDDDAPLYEWTKKELADECKTLGLSDKGVKAVLIARINEAKAAGEPNAEEVPVKESAPTEESDPMEGAVPSEEAAVTEEADPVVEVDPVEEADTMEEADPVEEADPAGEDDPVEEAEVAPVEVGGRRG